MFLAGLVDWCGEGPPTPDALASKAFIEKGVAHIRSIQRTGGSIIGHLAPTWADPESINVFRYMPVWGYEYAIRLADRHFP